MEQKKLVEFTEELSKEMSFHAEVFYKRLWLSKIKITLPLALIVCHISTNVSDVVMWAWTLVQLSRKVKVNKKPGPFGRSREDYDLLLGDLTLAFPMGHPNEKARLEIWDDQKSEDAPNGNKVDDVDVWKNLIEDGQHRML